MIQAVQDPRIRTILSPPGADEAAWQRDLDRFEAGDVTLTRRSAGEHAIMALQRLLIFLGYSTSSSGAFAIDGDFGRGTNRGGAQFQFEHGLTRTVDRATLCYPCTWRTARQNITTIPDVRLTPRVLDAMLGAARTAIDAGQVMCGDVDVAVGFLNDLHARTFLTCRKIFARYGALVHDAVGRLKQEKGTTVQPEWVLAIIRQETAGVVRPRFEQHLLTRFDAKEPDADFAELRYRSMSFGLGQILGVNYKTVGAASARAMFTSPLDEQVLFVARFLTASSSSTGRPAREAVARRNPTEADFRAVARYYNGPGYEAHHYHERIASWFKEFKPLTA